MFERMARSFELAKSSWNVLYSDKKLVLFPILSGFFGLLVLASFVGPIVGLQLSGQINLDPDANGGQLPIWIYPTAFAFYFCSYFVIIFFNSALVACAIKRFNGEEPTLGDGLSMAASRLPQILAWALVSATVGVLLKVVESLNEKVGEIIAALLGTAWTILTFFVIPVLVIEKAGPFEAVSRSLALLRKAWGEALIGGIGLGLFKFLLALPGILILLGGGFCLAQLDQPWVGVTVLGVGLIYLLLYAAVAAALDTIFLSALYQYAAFESVPQGFSREVMAEAFRNKKAS